VWRFPQGHSYVAVVKERDLHTYVIIKKYNTNCFTSAAGATVTPINLFISYFLVLWVCLLLLLFYWFFNLLNRIGTVERTLRYSQVGGWSLSELQLFLPFSIANSTCTLPVSSAMHRLSFSSRCVWYNTSLQENKSKRVQCLSNTRDPLKNVPLRIYREIYFPSRILIFFLFVHKIRILYCKYGKT